MTPVEMANSDLDVRVSRKELIAEGVVRLTLQNLNGAPFPVWAPGAHMDLVLPGGVVRQYSLCGNPADRSVLEMAILKEPASRGGSRYVHDTLRRGDHVRVRGPRNHFELKSARRILFIAGGIGITPLIPMLFEAEARGSEWRLLYGGRSRTSMAFWDELVAWRGERVVIWPQDELGLLDLDTALTWSCKDTLVYCCGPAPLLDAVERRSTALPPNSLHLERFVPRDDILVDKTGDFQVELASSGETLAVPSGKSILEVLDEAGIVTYSSCHKGTCGSCETRVLDGEIDHRDDVLSDEEREAGDVMMICVSRGAGRRLLLDV